MTWLCIDAGALWSSQQLHASSKSDLLKFSLFVFLNLQFRKCFTTNQSNALHVGIQNESQYIPRSCLIKIRPMCWEQSVQKLKAFGCFSLLSSLQPDEGAEREAVRLPRCHLRGVRPWGHQADSSWGVSVSFIACYSHIILSSLKSTINIFTSGLEVFRIYYFKLII